MDQTLDTVFMERRRQAGSRRWRMVVVSAALHVVIGATAILAPALAARNRPRPEYVAVKIVPLQALGVPDPPPVQQAPAQSKPEPVEKQPEPTPPPVETKPKARPAPAVRSDPPPKPRPRQREEAAPPSSGSRNDPPPRLGSRQGSSLGSSAFGTTVAGLDNPDFTYSYYIDQMLSMIRAQWVPPPLGGSVEAMVHFRIDKRGAVTDVKIVSSSGYNQFDLAGLRAVQKAAPFPPLPQSYKQGSLGVNLVMR